MNSQQFLILNLVLLSIFVVWFLAGRRSAAKKPTRLDMRRGNAAPGGTLQKEPETSMPTTKVVHETTNSGRYSHPRYRKYLEGEEPAKTKELNILFNYNGHTWDAYEVFGLPAGANIVDVTKAYQEALREASPRSHEFLETAFKAILAKK